MTSGIYRIELGNGWFYIGSSNNLSRRENQHLNALKRGDSHNVRMQRNWNKYKSFKFVILELCCENNLLIKEQALLNVYFKTSKCLNSIPVAGRTTGYKHTDAVKKILSKPKSDDHRKKLSDAMKTSSLATAHLKQLHQSQIGRHPSNATRKKMSKSGMDVPHSEETYAKVAAHLRRLNKSRIGLSHSAEHCAKLSAVRKGKKHSVETRLKMSAAAKAYHLRKAQAA